MRGPGSLTTNGTTSTFVRENDAGPVNVGVDRLPPDYSNIYFQPSSPSHIESGSSDPSGMDVIPYIPPARHRKQQLAAYERRQQL